MKKILFCLLAFSLLAGAEGQVKPDLKCGLIIHWGLLPFTGDVYQGGKTKNLGQIPQERFQPEGQDARQWARVAEDGGMTYAILVAKHEDGFCLWPGADSDYTIAQSPCKLDLIGSFIAACQSEGLLPGLDYSRLDQQGGLRQKG